MIASWVSEYVGIPFKSNGRDRDGCDCYGLVRMVLSEQFGYLLPSLSTDYTDALNVEETQDLFKKFLPVIAGIKTKNPEPGNLVIVRCKGVLTHVGIYAGDGFILNTLGKTGSVVQRLSSIDLRTRVEGIYRVSEDYRTTTSILIRKNGIPNIT